ncbi:MAG: ABC transporter substrate-binding protein [Thermomicrobiales bacterium]|nr:ABC transporter substrate-binding protein [Thermomicrobiales bacterium]
MGITQLNRRTLVQGVAVGAVGIHALAATNSLAQSDTTVKIGVSEDGYRTDERANVGFYPLNTGIFESLVHLGEDYQIKPLLAESWEFVEPNTWRITLRQDVSFHDGTAFNAEAVKYTMDRIASNGGGSMGLGADSCVIVDDFTVEITSSRPNRRLMQQIGHPNNSILPVGLNPAESRIGTGPFKEVEYVAGDHFTVETNAEYWGDDKPEIAGITFNFYPDPTARMLALQAGDVDMITDVSRPAAGQVEQMGATLLRSPVGGYEAFYIQIHGEEPYHLGADPAVREAISLAIDRNVIVQNAWQGNAEPGHTMIPPAILGDSVSIVAEPTYDLEKAKSLLEEAGWTGDDIRAKDGTALTLTIINGYGTAADHGTVPEILQAQLREAGIDLQIVQTPDTATYEQRLSLGEGDLWLEAGSQNDGNPGFLPGLLFASPEEGGDPESTMYGRAFAPGAAFDEQIEITNNAVDMAEVQEAAALGMNLLINEEHIVVPLCGFFRMVGASEKITEFSLHPSGVNQRWTSLRVKG